MPDFFPDTSLADKDDEEEESSENIAEVDDSEEDINGLYCGARCHIRLS